MLTSTWTGKRCGGSPGNTDQYSWLHQTSPCSRCPHHTPRRSGCIYQSCNCIRHSGTGAFLQVRPQRCEGKSSLRILSLLSKLLRVRNALWSPLSLMIQRVYGWRDFNQGCKVINDGFQLCAANVVQVCWDTDTSHFCHWMPLGKRRLIHWSQCTSQISFSLLALMGRRLGSNL